MGYERIYHKEPSAALGQDMEFLVLGHGGAPVLVFPTSRGRFHQWEDFGMTGPLKPALENGWLQLFCVDSIDTQTWYNMDCSPEETVERHLQYDSYLAEEFVPRIREINPVDFLMVTGTSFGAFHAVNFGFRHPDLVKRIVAMSGDYCIRKYLDDHYDVEVYYNCPVDFLPNVEGELLESLRSLDVILTAGDWDFCLGPTKRLSDILRGLKIPHRMDVWGDREVHDWPLWKKQAVRYL